MSPAALKAVETDAEPAPLTGLALLRAPFPDHQISKLPKPTAKREEMEKLPKASCKVCGGYHATSKIIHLDYVGHAALTDRLLDADPLWTWEPMALNPDGSPATDRNGGMWIKLTVCGVSRIGYGSADGKTGGDAVKEIIGDALRNAAMRFGAALDLWHKGDLHADEAEAPTDTAEQKAIAHLKSCAINRAMFTGAWESNKPNWKKLLSDDAYARVVAAMKEIAASIPADEPREEPRTVETPFDDIIPF